MNRRQFVRTAAGALAFPGLLRAAQSTPQVSHGIQIGDPFPDRGAFYRSDQFELARVGVPVVYARGGPNFIGRPPGWGQQMQEEFERRDYHQVTDEYHGDWDFSGAVEDAQLLLLSGLRIANDPKLPEWKPGDEFEAARKKALAEAR